MKRSKIEWTELTWNPITCWKNDPERGEANFDIDDDNIIPDQLDLFSGEVRRPKKVDLFERGLGEKILSKELQNDQDVYLFTLENGFIPSHAREVIKLLIKEKKIATCNLNLTHKICSPNSVKSQISII